MRTICGFLILLLIGCDARDSSGPLPEASSGNLLSEGELRFFGESADSGTLAWTDSKTFRLVGDGRGYAYTRESYRDFTLRLEFRWLNVESLAEEARSEANTGVLLFISGEETIWPRCLEVQGKWTDLGQIKSNARDVKVAASEDDAARRRARKPVGQWNTLEIVARDGAVRSTLNGVAIAASEATALREGPIGFQLERFDVEFRNVEIQAD